jgi:hypothetical protein
MSIWTDDETRELVALWPKTSAAQIAGRLQRSRSSICRKAQRLRQDGLLPDGAHKYFEVVPMKAPPRRRCRILPPKPPSQVDDSLAMQPCSILELDTRRCRWPLGEMHQVAMLFCGGATADGRRYCADHLRMASRN